MVIRSNSDDVTVTNDEDHIRDWVEDHNGKPAISNNAGAVDVNIDIKFEDEDSSKNLEVIEWPEFFKILDQKDLAFAYMQDGEGHLKSERFDFVNRTEPNTEMEEGSVFGNTLETMGGHNDNDEILP